MMSSKDWPRTISNRRYQELAATAVAKVRLECAMEQIAEIAKTMPEGIERAAILALIDVADGSRAEVRA